ncbi:MAG TPA: pyruvate dehydrogenase (acetyl-transferring) E1 component subunit alpha [Thermomicrobiaceae bacterium]|nr:pyruvate dehydrogenase (acetyl-transferring) E1 component subunit alpha [Thermomicrobiaceae bacterium]
MEKGQLLDLYRKMVEIRRFEEKAAEQYAHGKIGGFLHLYIGEEAVAVGAISAMQPRDHLVTHYRDHGYPIALGLDPRAMMAELFGKATGISGGRGGSMHMSDPEHNFWGGYAIVGGHLPLAAGLALANQYLDKDAVVVCFFGDGSTNTGAFHEAMNLSAVWKLPILWVCENNLYGMGTAVEYVSAVRDMVKKASAYDIPAAQIDGQNLLEVREATEKALEHCRSGQGPFFIEAMTYRFRGHSMADPEAYRTKEEVETHRSSEDPIVRFGHQLVEDGVATQAELDRIDAEAEQKMDAAVQFAEESPAPAPDTLMEHIYAEPVSVR